MRSFACMEELTSTSAIARKAAETKWSPKSKAVFAPNFCQTDGSPRRYSVRSCMSSWTTDASCISSMAAAECASNSRFMGLDEAANNSFDLVRLPGVARW